jgi:hypothetical protein
MRVMRASGCATLRQIITAPAPASRTASPAITLSSQAVASMPLSISALMRFERWE